MTKCLAEYCCRNSIDTKRSFEGTYREVLPRDLQYHEQRTDGLSIIFLFQAHTSKPPMSATT